MLLLLSLFFCPSSRLDIVAWIMLLPILTLPEVSFFCVSLDFAVVEFVLVDDEAAAAATVLTVSIILLVPR
jgi:hypothetical protein